ncbi:hypothetical protein CPR19088_GLDEOEPO_01384 [Companilactobacillus paralimentarius]
MEKSQNKKSLIEKVISIGTNKAIKKMDKAIDDFVHDKPSKQSK